MGNGPEILVVEDEQAQLDILAYNLRKAGYTVTTADDGLAAEAALTGWTPDLILLDWMLPGLSGLELARRIRAKPASKSTPILMLTARGEEDDVVRGLDIGANDYVTKPYSMTELMARVRSNLRNHSASHTDMLTVGPITLNIEAHRVYVNDQEITVGPIEFKLLHTLMSRPGRVFDRNQLLDKVWGQDVYVGTRTVDVHMGRLRKALGPEASALFRTVRGEGYSLT